MQEQNPLVSIIIPYLNASDTIGMTIKSILSSTYENYEIITINDKSEDDSFEEIKQAPGIHLSMIQRSGAAVARNMGVENSEGDIIFFIDADVTIQPETLEEVVKTFYENPDISACFGQYTPLPHGENFSTVYKNLVHHFTHQNSNENAQTFWCGCGAILRGAFLEVGGFDESFVAASVEDIDLGYRLSNAGKVILLNKKLQVTHGKVYSIKSLVISDFFNRAIPWTKLMASRNIFVPDLNLKWNNILSGLMLFILPPIFFALISAYGVRNMWWAPLFLIIGYTLLNRRILSFVMKQKGIFFTVLFFIMYTVTYVYSSIGFALGIVAFIKDRLIKKGKKDDK